jgi:hypothetical protein
MASYRWCIPIGLINLSLENFCVKIILALGFRKVKPLEIIGVSKIIFVPNR